MIKLKSIIESFQEVDKLFESPIRIKSFNIGEFDNHHKNYEYVKNLRDKFSPVDKFGKYDVFQMDMPNGYNDFFIYNDFIVAYFNYDVENNNFIEKKVWQDPIQLGLCRDILFNYYLKRYKRIISDGLHTEMGEKYWKKLLKQAIDSVFNVYILKNDRDKIKIQNIGDLNNFYKSVIYRFVIEKV